MVAIFSNVGMMKPMASSKRPSVTCFSSLVSTSVLCLSTAAGGLKITGPPVLNQHSPISASISSSTTRRSGNYEPTMWDFQFIQSLNNHYAGDKYMKRFDELKKEMKKMMMVEGSQELDAKLELIDNLERLGVSYHFKDEIMQILRSIHQSSSAATSGDSLYYTALKFRLLRQHGFHISQDILNDFKDENGNLKQSICKDTKGLLELYEASFLSTETETTLKNASRFSGAHLKSYLDNHCGEDNLMVALVLHALELPRHWMMPRLETRWYKSIYERTSNANPLLLEFAKLDFNIVQAAHQEELKILSRWWKGTRLAEKLSFSRDRLVEDFFWSVGLVFEPQYGYCRRILAKVVAFVVVIDDIYDVYGTLDELEIFTDVVERWDLKAMEQLPDCMKICYLALFNSTNEMAYDILKAQGINVLPYLTKQWTDLCKAYLREARWYHVGYKPTLQEYMDNAWISIATPLEELKRGDVPKSIQCYMNEKGASKEEARKHISFLIKEMWELMNKDQREELLFSEEFIGIVLNFSRTSHCVYQHGDGHGIQNSHITNRISKLLFEPITM